MNEGHILITGGNSDIGKSVVEAIRKELKWPIIVTRKSGFNGTSWQARNSK